MRQGGLWWLLPLAALALAAASCDDDGPTVPEQAPNYCKWMPLDKGNWWEYQAVEERMFSPPEAYKLRFEITDVRENYKGRRAYVISVSKDGKPQYDLLASALDDAAYIERSGSWAYLMADSITKGTWSQTGLTVDFPLQYRGDQRRTAPAGRFDCREMFRDNENEYKPQTWNEYYAEWIGMVGYYYTYKEYDTSTPPQLLDWRTATYDLSEFNINH